MHRAPTLRYLEPRIRICSNGCVHLQIGPAIVVMSGAGLRALARIASDAVDALPADKAAGANGTARSIN